MALIGRATGNLKVRSGPGMQYEPPIAYLTPGTEIEILNDYGDWLHVLAPGWGGQVKEGYVGSRYVEIIGER
jgi:uncharacterized protein YraI